MLNLLVRGDFPRLWLPSAEERDVRVLVEHRHQLVELRTRAKNGLQAMALSYGLRRGRLWSERGQEALKNLPLKEGMARLPLPVYLDFLFFSRESPRALDTSTLAPIQGRGGPPSP